MEGGFERKLEVSVTEDAENSLRDDTTYFASITDRDILDKNFGHDVEECQSTSDEEEILPSNEDGSIYLKSNDFMRNLPPNVENTSLGSLTRNSGDIPLNLCLNDVKLTSSGHPHAPEQCKLILNTAKSVNRLPADGNSQEFDPVRNTWVTTKADKAQLRSSGLTWRTGKWTDEETELLKSNISKYCSDHNIEDPRDIIYNASKDDRPQFYPTIAAGLNRPVFAVYRRVKRMYDAQNYRGKYSPEEVEKLKTLYKKYGHDWASIGNEMGRSSDSVKDRCRLVMNGAYKPGKWSEDEEIKLAQAVYSHAEVEEGTSVTSGICWMSVAKRVGTRNQKQCRAKWLNYLNWKMSNGEKWTKHSDVVLLEKIARSGAKSEEEIDWQEISNGWKSSRSPQWLRIKWWSLKQYYLQESAKISDVNFGDLLKALSQMILEQIHSFVRPSKRLGTPLDQTAEAGEKSKIPPKKTLKPKPVASKAERRDAENLEDLTLLYVKSPQPSEITEKLVYVTDSKADVGNEIMFNEGSNSDDVLQSFANPQSINHERQYVHIRENSEMPVSEEQTVEVPISDGDDLSVPMNTTIELTPTSTPGVYLFQNSLMFVLSEDANSVEFVPTDDSMIRADSSLRRDDEMVSNHSGVITTSDVLVYQETDDDIKNPLLGSAVHEVATTSTQDNDEDSCFIQCSSPLQGTLLEGTDLATATLNVQP